VNLSGAELGTALPGTYGTDYTYPTAAELDYFKSKGLILIRLPVKWERLQHALNGPLDTAEAARVHAVLTAAGTRAMKVVLDIHNFTYYNGFAIGSPEVPYSAFKNLWASLAAEFKNDSGLYGYGLMNEPRDTGGKWPQMAQAGMDGVRSVDRVTKVFIAGEGSSRAGDWRTFNESLNVIDVAHNHVYEAHVFFDHDGSGVYSGSYDMEGGHDDVGVERLTPFVAWLKAHGQQGYVGAYGVPADDPRWNTALDHALKYMNDNCLAGSYWSAGPMSSSSSPSDRLSVEPVGDADRAQMSVLSHYTRNAACLY
jgi:endoglucanase